jgi:molecular chaperone DnaK (HSP70)
MLPPAQVSAEVLKAALSLAEAYLGRRVPEAVVTVPAYFTREQRAATLEVRACVFGRGGVGMAGLVVRACA